MYAIILILMLAIAVMGYCLRHLFAVNEKLRWDAKARIATIQVQERRLAFFKAAHFKDSLLIEDLTFQQEAQSTILETLIQHYDVGVFTDDLEIKLFPAFVERSEKRKERAKAYLDEVESPERISEEVEVVASTSTIPAQRTPAGNGSAYFKETA